MKNKIPFEKINGDFKNKDIISLDQFDIKSIEKLFLATNKIFKLAKADKVKKILLGKITTLLFFEPSSRTFASFASAIKRLGGLTVEYQNPEQTSSTIKGGSLEDTIKVFETYSDLVVMRHHQMGAAKRACQATVHIPIINAGDGIGEHPTQALLDLYTIKSKFGRLDNLVGLIAGDLLYGRTVHSLIKGLALFSNNKLYLLSPNRLKLSKDFHQSFKNKIELIEIEDEKEIPENCHFWYWTRVQKERFDDIKEYERIKNKLIITPELLQKKGNKSMVIMHPLPRVGEIDVRVDDDPRAIYLKDQIRNGLYVRMALLALVLGRI